MTIEGRCHCGDTQFEMLEFPTSLTRCTCSICSKRGALWAYCKPEHFTLTKQPEHVSVYQWGHRLVKSHFCGICGCTTYNESPSSVDGKPDFSAPLVAVNARLLDGFAMDAMTIHVVDGKNLW